MGENKNNNVTNNVPNANEAKTNASTVAQYVGKTASNEVVAGVGGFLDGLKYIFVEMPKRLFKGKEVTDADYNVNAADMGEQSLVQKVSERLEDAYNNIPSVKAAREKREAALVPIKIDPKSADAVKNDVKVVYQYLARNKEGKVIKGYFPAFSKVDVYFISFCRSSTSSSVFSSEPFLISSATHVLIWLPNSTFEKLFREHFAALT